MQRMLFATFWFMVTISALHADIQYWNPTTTPRGHGDNRWGADSAAWSATTAGTNAPLRWVDGNTAWFTIGPKGTVYVDNPLVGAWNITQSQVFRPGTGPMRLVGPLVATGETQNNIWCDIELQNDLVISNSTQVSIFGAITGGHNLCKVYANTLTLSNAFNNLSSLWIDSLTLNAYGGGNTLGGPDADVILGHPEATGNSAPKLNFFALRDRATTDWNARDFIVKSYSELSGENSVYTNAINFRGTLQRENRGVISLATTGVPTTTQISFSNLESLGNERGILPLWFSATEFLRVNSQGLVEILSPTRHNNPMDDPTDVIYPSSARTFTDGETAYGLKLGHMGFVVPSGVTVTNVGGGFVMKDSSVLGSGSFELGDAEAIIYMQGGSERRFEPRINTTGGLTLFGNNSTLTVTNLSWRGDTTLWTGTIKAVLENDSDVPFNIRGFHYNTGARSYFTKEGAGALTFDGKEAVFSAFNFNAGPALTIKDSSVEVAYGLQLNVEGMSVLVTNSVLRNSNDAHTTGAGKNNINIHIIDSVLDGWSGLHVGVNGGSNNRMVVDGTAATNRYTIRPRSDGAVHENKPGLSVGRGANSQSNVVSIVNGGSWHDFVTVSNNGNAVGEGTNANWNRLEVIGGDGVVSSLLKVIPNNIGNGQGTTGNEIVIDGKGYPGSALFQIPGGSPITVGRDEAPANRLVVRDGGVITGGSLTVGRGSFHNSATLTGTGTKWVADAGNATFEIGVPYSVWTNSAAPVVRLLSKTVNACSNEVVIADGARFSNFKKWQTVIGGAGNPGNESDNYGDSFDNRVLIGTNGYWLIENETYIGRVYGAGHVSTGNALVVNGPGATVVAGYVAVGTELGNATYGYSKSFGNMLIVENEGFMQCSYIAAGHRATTSVEGEVYDNRIYVRNNGHLYVSNQVRLGADNDYFPRDNAIEVTAGGVLEANTVRLCSPNNNTLRIFDRGVWQLRGARAPTYNSRRAGEVYRGAVTIENGVLSITNTTNVAVRDNWTQAGFANIVWAGNNAFRLNNLTIANNVDQSYLFEPNITPTNYFRLEMVNGTTRYQTRAQDTGSLTIGSAIGSGASMLCSNTVASVALPFVCNGELTLFNSTLTLEKPAALNGEVVVDLSNLPASGVVLTTQQALELGAGSSLRFIGVPPERGTYVFITSPGGRNGKFGNVSGMPKDYNLHYDVGGSGNIAIHWSLPQTLFMVR